MSIKYIQIYIHIIYIFSVISGDNGLITSLEYATPIYDVLTINLLNNNIFNYKIMLCLLLSFDQVYEISSHRFIYTCLVFLIF